MAESYAELRKLDIQTLIEKYDSVAKHTVDSQVFLREEIARRDAEQQTTQMIRLNQQMRTMTLVIVALTIVNTVAVIVSLFHG